jgi:hypothetical protein
MMGGTHTLHQYIRVNKSNLHPSGFGCPLGLPRSSSWSRRTATSSRRRHLSPEEVPHHCKPQPLPAKPFATLGEHHRDPVSVLPLSLSCLVHQSALDVVLRRAARPCNGVIGCTIVPPLGCTGTILHRPSMDEQPRLEAAYPFICIKSIPQIVG